MSEADLVRWARKAGLRVTRTRKGHFKVHTAAGFVVMAGTPSDGRGARNARAQLRRKLRAAGWPEAALP